MDLIPICAGETDSLETARFTSVSQRLQSQSQRQHARDRTDGSMAEPTLRPERKADEALAHFLPQRMSRLRSGSASDIVGGLRDAAQVDNTRIFWDASRGLTDLEVLYNHVRFHPLAGATTFDDKGSLNPKQIHGHLFQGFQIEFSGSQDGNVIDFQEAISRGNKNIWQTLLAECCD